MPKDREMIEAEEAELLQTLMPFKRALGEEAFSEAIVRAALPYEAELRAKCAPDHPMLALIDEWRAGEERAPGAFDARKREPEERCEGEE